MYSGYKQKSIVLAACLMSLTVYLIVVASEIALVFRDSPNKSNSYIASQNGRGKK